jgi:hypothetical protein
MIQGVSHSSRDKADIENVMATRSRYEIEKPRHGANIPSIDSKRNARKKRAIDKNKFSAQFRVALFRSRRYNLAKAFWHFFSIAGSGKTVGRTVSRGRGILGYEQ